MRSTMIRCLCSAIATLALTAGTAAAQAPAAAAADDATHTKAAQAQLQFIHDLVVKSLEKVGDDVLAFKPTADVRSFAGVVGHIADGQNLLCGVATGQDVKFNPVNEKKTTKADLLAALKESKAGCDAVFAKLNDTNSKELVNFFGRKTPKLAAMNVATMHTWEHYGNLVTYMRLKNIVPPSSERQPSSGNQ